MRRKVSETISDVMNSLQPTQPNFSSILRKYNHLTAKKQVLNFKVKKTEIPPSIFNYKIYLKLQEIPSSFFFAFFKMNERTATVFNILSANSVVCEQIILY